MVIKIREYLVILHINRAEMIQHSLAKQRRPGIFLSVNVLFMIRYGPISI